ncbi:HNH endonuclease [Asaia prunellae]|uniref:HNH endonuclease n=1 Tax=Asaia prunellae TaxID=610245 RepID=UPI000A050BB4
MSTARRWTKWWWQDWQRDPALRMCSPAARGIWMDLLAIMFDAEPCGHLLVNGRRPTERQLAAVCGASVDELTSCLSELEEAGAFSRSEDGTIFNRRMVRDKAISDEASANGTEGGNPLLRRGSVPKSERVRPYRKSDSPEKTKRIIARSNGKCFWCGVKLRISGQAGPDYCHIDHLKPVCDGGSNDESNLVAACAACNHARARKDWSHPSDPYLGVGVGSFRHDGKANSDLKHQEAEAEAYNPIVPLRTNRRWISKQTKAAIREARRKDQPETSRNSGQLPTQGRKGIGSKGLRQGPEKDRPCCDHAGGRIMALWRERPQRAGLPPPPGHLAQRRAMERRVRRAGGGQTNGFAASA